MNGSIRKQHDTVAEGIDLSPGQYPFTVAESNNASGAHEWVEPEAALVESGWTSATISADEVSHILLVRQAQPPLVILELNNEAGLEIPVVRSWHGVEGTDQPPRDEQVRLFLNGNLIGPNKAMPRPWSADGPETVTYTWDAAELSAMGINEIDLSAADIGIGIQVAAAESDIHARIYRVGGKSVNLPTDDEPKPDDGDPNPIGPFSAVDLLNLLAQWGPCVDCRQCPADLSGNCNVGIADLLLLLANWQ
ncbi:MAG: hypothetical protein EA377_13010 [Phycisphaerales bacterium]|nr:MAG: hypothetical protein EA377_13010 [Phycisphaerales bacterium]